MRVSREKFAANRERIVDAAAMLFRDKGFGGVGLADIMRTAGLTHGGFYGYFASKDALIAGTLADVLARRPEPSGDLAAYAAGYLSRTHRDNRASGCPTAALAAEATRLDGDARAEMTDGLRRQVERLSRIAPGRTAAQRRQAAIGSWAAMVGAMTLARFDDPRRAQHAANLIGAKRGIECGHGGSANSSAADVYTGGIALIAN